MKCNYCEPTKFTVEVTYVDDSTIPYDVYEKDTAWQIACNSLASTATKQVTIKEEGVSFYSAKGIGYRTDVEVLYK